MGYDLFAAILFALLTPLVIAGFIAFWVMTHRERTQIEETWQSFAAARARQFVPARGEWPNRTSPSIRWRRADVDFDLTLIGLEAGARTRLAARPRGRLLGAFLGRAGDHGDLTGTELDAAFARTFAVSEKPNGLATRVLDDAARRALLGFRQRDDVAFGYRRGRVILEWPGREANDARLDEAERVVEELVRGVEAAFSGAGTHARRPADGGVPRMG